MQEGEYDFSEMKKEISDLNDRARALEKWLFNNINSPEYGKKASEYAGVLFRKAQKEMKIESIRSGYQPPDTLNISSGLRIKR